MINYVLAGIGFLFKTIAKLTSWVFKGTAWYFTSVISVLKKDKRDSKGKHSITGEIF